jgi:hypothetical protein
MPLDPQNCFTLWRVNPIKRIFMRSIITAALMLFCFFSSNSFAHDTGNCAQVESALERLDCYDGQAKLLSSLPTGDEAVSSKVVSQPSAPSAPPESPSNIRQPLQRLKRASKKCSLSSVTSKYGGFKRAI